MAATLNRQRASGSGAQGGGAGYVIENSLRFNSADSTKTGHTTNETGSTTTGTISVWVKRCQLGVAQYLFDVDNTSEHLTFNASDQLQFAFRGGAKSIVTTQVFRDPTAWYHIVIRIDTTLAEANRLRMYINGVQITNFVTEAQPTSSEAFLAFLTNGSLHQWGSYTSGGGKLNAYLANAIIIGGTGYGPDSFGEYDSNGNWVPIDPSGLTFGTNGSWLDFAIAPGTGNGAGNDVSGNDNHFTDSGLAAADQVSDSPTDDADNDVGNACTWNPIFANGTHTNALTFSDGNLTLGTAYDSAVGTIAPTEGKYYFEFNVNDTWGGNTKVGVVSLDDYVFSQAPANIRGEVAYHADDGNKSIDGTESSYGNSSSVASGEYIGVALDLDNGAIWFNDNGTWVDGDGTDSSDTIKAEIEAGTTDSSASAGLTAGQAYTIFFWSGTTGDSATFISGAGLSFNGTAPAGFKALNTANLPAPAVKDPSEGFVIVEDAEANIAATLATARSGWTDYIDFIKDKSSTDSWIVRFSDDSTNHMKFDTNAATATFPTLSGSNVHVGYSLRVGAAYGVFTDSVSHTNGTDTDTAHGLGSNNKWCLAKLESTTGSWYHKHPANSASKNNTIDVSGAEGTTFYVDVDGTNVTIQSAAPTGTYRVWVLEETSGLISLPQYTGNGSADGPYVSFGHTPHWLWRWGISVADNYYTNNAVTSPYNQTNHRFILDVAQAAGTDADIDILAGGYKVRQTTPNTSGTVYGCISFGSRPFGGEGVSQARSR